MTTTTVPNVSPNANRIFATALEQGWQITPQRDTTYHTEIACEAVVTLDAVVRTLIGLHPESHAAHRIGVRWFGPLPDGSEVTIRIVAAFAERRWDYGSIAVLARDVTDGTWRFFNTPVLSGRRIAKLGELDSYLEQMSPAKIEALRGEQAARAALSERSAAARSAAEAAYVRTDDEEWAARWLDRIAPEPGEAPAYEPNVRPAYHVERVRDWALAVLVRGWRDDVIELEGKATVEVVDGEPVATVRRFSDALDIVYRRAVGTVLDGGPASEELEREAARAFARKVNDGRRFGELI